MAFELKPNVALIACSKEKQPGLHEARDLYQGQLFKKSLYLAKLQGYDWIFVLSAKYHLLSLGEVVRYYDMTLSDMTKEDRKAWAQKVVEKMKRQIPKMEKAQFTYYAGKLYYQNLPKGRCPFSGKKIGQILRWLNNEISRYGG